MNYEISRINKKEDAIRIKGGMWLHGKINWLSFFLRLSKDSPVCNGCFFSLSDQCPCDKYGNLLCTHKFGSRRFFHVIFKRSIP